MGALLSLDDRVALVTGAATGIGEGIAGLLARAGAHVVVADIDTDGAEQVAAEVDGTALALDVTDASACREAIDDLERLDVLVNNAGSYLNASGSILDQDYEAWAPIVEVNYHSLFHVSKPAAERMVAQGDGGAIVNIASVDGILPCLGTAYDSAKAAAIHFTRSLAVDLAPHGIRVNAIAPGAIQVETLARMHAGELPPVWTPGSPTGLMGDLMRRRSANIPLGRRGEPDDVARAALFLATEASSYITGQVLQVDGGWTLV